MEGSNNISTILLLGGAGVAAWLLYEHFANSVSNLPVSTNTGLTNVQQAQLAQIQQYQISSSDLQNIITSLQQAGALQPNGYVTAGQFANWYYLAKGLALPTSYFSPSTLGPATPGEFANVVNGAVQEGLLNLQTSVANAGVSGLGNIGQHRIYPNHQWSNLQVWNQLARR